MDKDPSSYRVPILRLKDMLLKNTDTDDENASKQDATDAGAPQQNQPTPQQQGLQPDQSRVSEDAIARAIIKPKGQSPQSPAQVPPNQQNQGMVQSQGIQTPPQQTAPQTPPQGQVPTQQTPPVQQPQGQVPNQVTPPAQQQTPPPLPQQPQSTPASQQNQQPQQQFVQQQPPAQQQQPAPPQPQSTSQQSATPKPVPTQQAPLQQPIPQTPPPPQPPQQTQQTPPAPQPSQSPPAPQTPPETQTKGSEVFDIDTALGEDTTKAPVTPEMPKKTPTPQEEKQKETPAQAPVKSIDELLDDVGKPEASEEKPVPEMSAPVTPPKETPTAEKPAKAQSSQTEIKQRRAEPTPQKTETPAPATPPKKEEKPDVPVPPLPKKHTEPEHEEIHIPIEPAQPNTPTKVAKPEPKPPQEPVKETPPIPPQKEPEPPVAPPQEKNQKETPTQAPAPKKSIDELLDDVGKPEASEEKSVPEMSAPATPQKETSTDEKSTKAGPETDSAKPAKETTVTPSKQQTATKQKPVEPTPQKTETPAPPKEKASTSVEKPKVPDTLVAEQEKMEAESTSETDDVDLQDLIGKSLALNEMNADIPKFNRKAPVKERSKEEEKPMRSFEGDSVLPTADALDIWERDAQKQKKSPPPKPKKKVPMDDVTPAPKEKVRAESEEKTTPEPVLPPQEDKQKETPAPVQDPKKQSIDELLDDIGKPKETEKESAKSKLLSPQKPKHTPVSNLSALRQKVLSKSASGDIQEASETEERPRPGSKHASAIADVADKLQTMSGQGNVGEDMETEAQTTSQEGVEGQETEQAPEKPTVPHMRTFRSDVQQAVMKNKTSVVDMLSAEEKRKGLGETVRRAPRAKKTSPLSYVLMGASIMLLVAGVGVGGYFAYKYFSSDRGANTAEIIPANEYVQHDITGQAGKELRTGMNEIKNALQASLNDVTKLRMIERFDENDSTKITFVSPQEFFKKLDTRAPGSLIRTTGDRMTLGVHTLRENEPFWVFSIEQYETAFRGMLEWEDSIREDLSPYFDSNLPPIIDTSEPEPARSTTATSATSTQIDDFIERPDKPQRTIDVFEDTVIANREARILTDEAGRTLLIWSIPDTKNVLITTNKASFEELVQRMTARVY